MAFTNFFEILSIAAVILVGLLVMGLILARLYRRASKEVSFVRTGFGGQKVIMNGGASGGHGRRFTFPIRPSNGSGLMAFTNWPAVLIAVCRQVCKASGPRTENSLPGAATITLI